MSRLGTAHSRAHSSSLTLHKGKRQWCQLHGYTHLCYRWLSASWEFIQLEEASFMSSPAACRRDQFTYLFCACNWTTVLMASSQNQKQREVRFCFSTSNFFKARAWFHSHPPFPLSCRHTVKKTNSKPTAFHHARLPLTFNECPSASLRIPFHSLSQKCSRCLWASSPKVSSLMFFLAFFLFVV